MNKNLINRFIIISLLLVFILFNYSCKQTEKIEEVGIDLGELTYYSYDVYERDVLLSNNNDIDISKYITEEKQFINYASHYINSDGSELSFPNLVHEFRGFPDSCEFIQLDSMENRIFEFCHPYGVIQSIGLSSEFGNTATRITSEDTECENPKTLIYYYSFRSIVKLSDGRFVYLDQSYEFNVDYQFIEFIVKDEGHITGFVEVLYYYGGFGYLIKIIDSLSFPKVNGEYQDISYEVVAKFLSLSKQKALEVEHVDK